MALMDELIERYEDDPALAAALDDFDRVADNDEATPVEVQEVFDNLLDILKGFWLAEQEAK